MLSGCRYSIRIVNKSGSSKGVKRLEVDGAEAAGNMVPHVPGRKLAQIVAHM